MIFERALGPRLYPLSTVGDCYPLKTVEDPGDPVLASAAVHWGRSFYNQNDRRRPHYPSMLYRYNQSYNQSDTELIARNHGHKEAYDATLYRQARSLCWFQR